MSMVNRSKVMLEMWVSEEMMVIHSKSEDSGILNPAKKFELSANFSKNATKWPKNDPKWPKYYPKWPKMALE